VVARFPAHDFVPCLPSNSAARRYAPNLSMAPSRHSTSLQSSTPIFPSLSSPHIANSFCLSIAGAYLSSLLCFPSQWYVFLFCSVAFIAIWSSTSHCSLARSCPSPNHLSLVPALPLFPLKSHSLLSADFVLVFSPRQLSGRRLTRRWQHNRRANLVAHTPGRAQDGHSSQGRCRSCGSRCECASHLHALRRCRWEQQYHVEYVHFIAMRLKKKDDVGWDQY
jgi:hypothetical protein